MNFNMDRSLGFILNRTSLRSKAAFAQKLKRFDISPEQWSLLFRVVERSGLTQKELSESTYKDQANITRTVDRLEKKGLLKRVQNALDRRSTNLHPTKQAVALVEQIAPISTAYNEELTEGFSPEEREMLIGLLNRVYTNIEQKEKA